MAIIITFLLIFIVTFLVLTFLKSKYRLLKAISLAALLTFLSAILELFYLGNIVGVTLLFYIVLGGLFGHQRNFLKVITALFISTLIITIIMSFTYFNQLNDVTDRQVIRVLFIYYPLLIIINAFYIYIALNLFRIKIFESSRPLHYIGDKIRGFFRMIQMFIIVSSKGLLLALKQEDIKAPYILASIFEESGGVFIKFAQVLSTRRDLLPPSYINAFSNLRENVTPLPEGEVKEMLEKKIGAENVFSYFDIKPIAAASIGQVHEARLKNGTDVIVKILRPNIRQKMTTDLNLLIDFTGWLANRSKQIKNLGLVELSQGFKANLIEETDFEQEAMNTNIMRELLSNSNYPLKVPVIDNALTSKHILVMEKISGESIGKCHFDGIRAEEISRHLMFSFLEQILFLGTYHADPHPGNIFITDDGEIALIDFGSVGHLTFDERNGMGLFLMGFDRKNPQMMAAGILKLCEKNSIAPNKVSQAMKHLLIRTKYSPNPTLTMMKETMQLLNEMSLSLKPDVAGAFRSIITLDGTLTSLNPHYSLTQLGKEYTETINLSQVLAGQSKHYFEELESYALNFDFQEIKTQIKEIVSPRMIEEPHPKQTKIIYTGFLLFTTLILVIFSFYIKHEINTFLIRPLSSTGFFLSSLLVLRNLSRTIERDEEI